MLLVGQMAFPQCRQTPLISFDNPMDPILFSVKIKFQMTKYPGFLELDRSGKFQLLYPLIFREYMYAFVRDRGLTRRNFLKNVSSHNNYSLLVIKRLIFRMYQTNHLIFSHKDSNQNQVFGFNENLYYQMISEGFVGIVEMP
ncbi:hypothetical protein EON73_05760, partial [bacterium]